MDNTNEIVKWISKQRHFTYLQFSKQFNIPIKKVKSIFIKEFKKYYYKLRRNCLVYHRVTKIEEINIEIGGYSLAYKIYADKEVYYIPKNIITIYGLPVVGSYFSPLHFLKIRGYDIQLVYVVSFLTEKKFYTLFKLNDDLERWERKNSWRIVLRKFDEKYKFKNILKVLEAINSLKGKTI